jgi:hypothetical protein
MENRSGARRQCGLCGGELILLGTLGNRRHYRCRACGMDWSRKVRPRGVKKGGGSLKHAALMLLAVVLSACGRSELAAPSTPEPCQVQSMACFHSSATLYVGAALPIRTEVWSQDMPTPGFENRWHYLLPQETARVLAPYLSVWTEASIDGKAVRWPDGTGGQTMEAFGHWRLEMRPTDAHVAAQSGALAGAREARMQHFTVRRVGEWVEILIEEPMRK